MNYQDALEQLKAYGKDVRWVETMDAQAARDSSTVGPFDLVSAFYGDGDNHEAFIDLGSIARGECTASQSDCVHRSNFRSLQRDFPGLFVSINYTNVDSLGVFVKDLAEYRAEDDLAWPDHVVETLVKLKTEYPIYDEDDHSAFEMEMVETDIDEFVHLDIEVDPDLDEAWDAVTDKPTLIRAALVRYAMNVGGNDPYECHGVEISWDWDKMNELVSNELRQPEETEGQEPLAER